MAGIINPEEDDNDCMDPLHKVDYQEWRAGKHADAEDEQHLHEMRHHCIINTVTTVNRLKDPKFNPMHPQHRVQLLQAKYSGLSTFQGHVMNLNSAYAFHSRDVENVFASVIMIKIPNIRL